MKTAGNCYWRNLKVWQKAHELTLHIYKITSSFPDHEAFCLRQQLRKAAYSVPANIVEGQSRNTTKSYLAFLYNARGSINETRYFLLLSLELHYLEKSAYVKLDKEYEILCKMLNAMITKLKCKVP